MNVPLHEHQYLLEPRAPQCRVMSGWRAAVVLALVYQLGCRVTCDTDAETPSQRLAQWRALRNAAALSPRSSHSSHAASASLQGTECELEDGEGSREGASTRLKEWRSQRQGGERLQNHVMKQAHEGKECVSAAGVLKAVNFLRPDYEYEHDTVFKEMHRRAPPVTGVYICKCNRHI